MVPLAVVTGAGGLVGSEAVEHLIEQGFDVIGVDNDMRGQLFGAPLRSSRGSDA